MTSFQPLPTPTPSSGCPGVGKIKRTLRLRWRSSGTCGVPEDSSASMADSPTHRSDAPPPVLRPSREPYRQVQKPQGQELIMNAPVSKNPPKHNDVFFN